MNGSVTSLCFTKDGTRMYSHGGKLSVKNIYIKKLEKLFTVIAKLGYFPSFYKAV